MLSAEAAAARPSSSSKSPATPARALDPLDHQHQQQQMELPIRIYFKRTPLLLTTIVLVLVTSVLMYLCAHDGVRVESFEATMKDAHARKQLLDAYNSYSGNAVSLLMKPLEMFLAMVVAVSLLCFFTGFSTGEHPRTSNTRYNHVLLLSSAVAGYLLTNGFNALNAQLAPRSIESVITAQDLSLTAAESFVVDSQLSEYTGPERVPFMKPSDKRFLEEQDRNPLTNTILRNTLIPIALNPSPQCTLSGVTATVESRRNGAIASYGFPSRPWHQHALTKGLRPTRSLKIAIADNSMKILPKVISSDGLPSDDKTNALPIGTQQAIKLLAQSIAMTQLMLPWWEDSYLDELLEEKIKAKYTPALVPNGTDISTIPSRSVKLSDLLFDNSDSKQISPNEFLTQAKQIFFSFISKAPNASSSEIHVEFTRIANVSKGMMFDSLTIEIPLRKDHFQREYYFEEAMGGFTYRTNNKSEASASKQKNESYYYELDLVNDCSRDACLIKEPEYTYLGDESYTEPQVHALAVCVDEHGSEDPLVLFDYVNMSSEFDPIRLYSGFHCVKNSNTSMYSVSIGKRVQGDEMATEVLRHKDAFKDLRVLRLKNARKVYSITVTHISWELQELTKKYGAQCQDGGGTNSCRGLWYELDHPPNSESKRQQHLVVGASRLPLALLSAYNPIHKFMSEIHASTRLMPLVSKLMRRPASAYDFAIQTAPLFDLVYPRRFGKSDWPTKVEATTENCSVAVEDYVHHAESNHLYMEQTLQPSYTAGFFFLFQDAVVRDVLAQDTSSIDNEKRNSVVMLDFAGNVQWIDVNISSPTPNIVLTLLGAVLLFTTSVAICVCGGKAKEAQLQSLMSAHNVAELLIADKKYPPMLVGMSITTPAPLFRGDGGANKEEAQDVKQLQVDLPATPATVPGKATSANLECFRVQSMTLVHHESSHLVEFPCARSKQSDYV